MTAETKAFTYRKGKIHDISLDLLHRDVDQPRKHFDELELDALKKSIEDKGLLYPVLFRVDENGNNILVSGERRLRAFRSLGKENIPAMRAARVKLVVARLCSVESFISFFDHRFVDDSFAFRIERHCSHWTPITGTT